MLATAVLLLVLAQASNEAKPEPVTGRVIDTDERPLTGVDVFLSGIGSANHSRPILSRGLTDEEGRFRLDVDNKERARAFDWAVWAVRPGKALAAHGLHP